MTPLTELWTPNGLRNPNNCCVGVKNCIVADNFQTGTRLCHKNELTSDKIQKTLRQAMSVLARENVLISAIFTTVCVFTTVFVLYCIF